MILEIKLIYKYDNLPKSYPIFWKPLRESKRFTFSSLCSWFSWECFFSSRAVASWRWLESSGFAVSNFFLSLLDKNSWSSISTALLWRRSSKCSRTSSMKCYKSFETPCTMELVKCSFCSFILVLISSTSWPWWSFSVYLMCLNSSAWVSSFSLFLLRTMMMLGKYLLLSNSLSVKWFSRS